MSMATWNSLRILSSTPLRCNESKGGARAWATTRFARWRSETLTKESVRKIVMPQGEERGWTGLIEPGLARTNALVLTLFTLCDSADLLYSPSASSDAPPWLAERRRGSSGRGCTPGLGDEQVSYTGTRVRVLRRTADGLGLDGRDAVGDEASGGEEGPHGLEELDMVAR